MRTFKLLLLCAVISIAFACKLELSESLANSKEEDQKKREIDKSPAELVSTSESNTGLAVINHFALVCLLADIKDYECIVYVSEHIDIEEPISRVQELVQEYKESLQENTQP